MIPTTYADHRGAEMPPATKRIFMSNVGKGNWAEGLVAEALSRIPDCTIAKNSPEYRVTKRTGRTINGGFFLAPGKLDFSGGYKRMHVEFDVKRAGHKVKRWNFRSGIAEHQIDRAEKLMNAGDIVAFLLCWDQEGGKTPCRWFWVPYDVLECEMMDGAKSFSQGDLELLVEDTKVVELDHFDLSDGLDYSFDREV